MQRPVLLLGRSGLAETRDDQIDVKERGVERVTMVDINNSNSNSNSKWGWIFVIAQV